MADYTQFILNHLYRFQGAEAFLPAHNPTFGNPDDKDASCRVLIARLSPFRDVDRSLPHLFLFQEVRRALPQAYIDLAFFPARAERALFEEQGIPPLIGVQSRRSLEDFALVLFSNAYTLELINLPYLLLRCGAPLWSSQRGPGWPLLILGGSNAMASQAIVRADGDSMVDGIFFGEGEGQVRKLVSILARDCPPLHPPRNAGRGRQRRRRSDHGGEEKSRAPAPEGRSSPSPVVQTGEGWGGGLPKAKRDLLARAAAEVEGFWAAGGAAVTKATCSAPDARALLVNYPADKGRPLLNTAEADTAHLQINYGCPAFCSFCFEAYDRKPYREMPLPDLLDAARRIKRAQGSEELNVYSFNFNAHADILALLPALHRLYDRVGATSQRVDILQHTPHLLEAEVAADKRSYTLGIEGISERQRAFLHKSLSTNDILNLLGRLFESRIREVKLFYILTGHEDEADVAEFRQFLRDLKATRRGRRRRVRLIFSFGLLIRMPFTPLRHDRLFLDEEHWRPLIGQAKSACETNGFEFRLAYDWPVYCATQVLALGSYWLAEPIVALAREGHCFDTDLPEGYWERLRAWMVREGRWNEATLGEKGPDYAFALDFVRSNVPPEFLYRQFQEAQEGVDGGYCLGSQDGDGRCLGCGACASPEQRAEIVKHRIGEGTAAPAPTTAGTANPVSAIREVMSRKRRLKPAYVRVRLDERLDGALPAFLNATVLRGLLVRCPELAESLLSARESLFTVRPNDRRFPPVTGETVFALKAWDVEAVLGALGDRSRDADRGSAPIAPDTAQESHSRAFHSTPSVEDTSRGMETASTSISSGFQILGPAEGFTPGAYTRVMLEMHLPARHFPEPRAHLERYLREAYLPYSLRREEPRQGGETRYRFDVPSKGIKKKIVFGGAFEAGASGMEAWLEIGPGFDVLAFMEGFGDRYLYRQARVHVAGVEW